MLDTGIYITILVIVINVYLQSIATQAAPLKPKSVIPKDFSPKVTPKVPTEPTKLPHPDRLLPPLKTPTSPSPSFPLNNNLELIIVKKFEVTGSSVFSDRELDAITTPYLDQPLSIFELLQIRTKITELYIDRGYITSGAYLPEQDLQKGIVKIQIVEGGLAEIKIKGLTRLNEDYIKSRLVIATGKPLNRNRLLEALQLLQINPLIENISANFTLDNSRTPSVGSERRQIQLNEANLTGIGDRLSISYSNTNGSNAFDVSYTIPFNPNNGTIGMSFGTSVSNVIEPPFNILDITSNSRNYELTLRQPILQNTVQDLALGLSLSHRQSSASLLNGLIPFPSIETGTDGQTRVTALRFFQEYVQRSAEEVFAVRSQINLGLKALGSTINLNAPDSQFVSWRGQMQYVRLFAPETLLLLRTDLQLSDRPLLSKEQINFGGQDNIRGYRQDALLSDNGLLLSMEMRIPLLRLPEISGLLQIITFYDFGTVWNHQAETNPDPSTLASVGVGLRFQVSDRLTIRIDLGIPLSRIFAEKKTLQENGIYFSILTNPF